MTKKDKFSVWVYGLKHRVNAVVYQFDKIHRIHIFGCKGAKYVVLDFKPLRKFEVAALGVASQGNKRHSHNTYC